MIRGALLIAALFALSCKKEVPKGDLPPPSSPPPSSGQTAAPSPGVAAPPSNPHAGMPKDDPHAGMPKDNPHAGMPSTPGPVAEKTAPKTLDKQADGKLALGPFDLTPPTDWTVKPTTSSMRAAAFGLPGKSGDAELIVYYFGPSGAGSVDSNLDRWLGQFQQPDGKPSRDVAKIEKATFGGQETTTVSVTGRYVAAAMPGATEAVDKPDQAMLAAIVASPSGPYYFKLVGPKATVDAHAKAFRGMLASLKVR